MDFNYNSNLFKFKNKNDMRLNSDILLESKINSNPLRAKLINSKTNLINNTKNFNTKKIFETEKDSINLNLHNLNSNRNNYKEENIKRETLESINDNNNSRDKLSYKKFKYLKKIQKLLKLDFSEIDKKFKQLDLIIKDKHDTIITKKQLMFMLQYLKITSSNDKDNSKFELIFQYLKYDKNKIDYNDFKLFIYNVVNIVNGNSQISNISNRSKSKRKEINSKSNKLFSNMNNKKINIRKKIKLDFLNSKIINNKTNTSNKILTKNQSNIQIKDLKVHEDLSIKHNLSDINIKKNKSNTAFIHYNNLKKRKITPKKINDNERKDIEITDNNIIIKPPNSNDSIKENKFDTNSINKNIFSNTNLINSIKKTKSKNKYKQAYNSVTKNEVFPSFKNLNNKFEIDNKSSYNELCIENKKGCEILDNILNKLAYKTFTSMNDNKLIYNISVNNKNEIYKINFLINNNLKTIYFNKTDNANLIITDFCNENSISEYDKLKILAEIRQYNLY